MKNHNAKDSLRMAVGIKKSDHQSSLSRNSMPDDRTEGLPFRPLLKEESTPNDNQTPLNGFKSIDSANFVL